MLAWHVGLRYLRRRRAAWLAVGAITLTVAAPVAVIGVTQGFLDELKRQARASESDVTIQEYWNQSGVIDDRDTRDDLLRVPGVAAVAPLVESYALIAPRVEEGHQIPGIPCQIDGVEWDSDQRLGRLDPHLLHPQPVEDLSSPPLSPEHRGSGLLTPAWREQLCLVGLAMADAVGAMPAPLPPSLRPIPGVVAGRELLYGSGLAVGEQVDLVADAQQRQQVEISDTIGTGILEVDKFELVTPLPIAQALRDFLPSKDVPSRVDGYRVQALPGTELNGLAARLFREIDVPAQTWMSRRINMVKSLEIQRNIMAIVMLAIQTIAVFVVYAVFSTLVAEKRHDIGVLLGIGARPREIAGAFLIAGLAACLMGGMLGWAIGWLVMEGLRIASKDFGILIFPQDVFYSPDTPISWDPRIPLAFIGAMAVIGLAAVALPAWRASRIQPVDILRAKAAEVRLHAQGLCRSYPGLEVLTGLDLLVGAGEVVAIRGTSGTGKSTLLHCLGLLDQPDRGTIDLDGVRLTGLPAGLRAQTRARSIGFVFQAFNLLPEFDVVENVLMTARTARQGLPAARERAQELLERVGLGSRSRSAIKTLSGGERQRVALCRALLPSPALLLADEPTGNLDPATAAVVLHQMLDLARSNGSSVVIVTHDPVIADQADRRLELRGGQLHALGDQA